MNDSIKYNNTVGYGSKKSFIYNIEVLRFLILVICLSGAVGNGTVIRFLGFHIKRNPFITYILNLAVADLGVLVSATFCILSILIPFYFHITYKWGAFLFALMYSASQFLLTAISIDRCVAVFFPLWHKCHQPKCLSSVVCAFMWLLSFLLTAVTCAVVLNGYFGIEAYYQFFVNGLLCLPVMTGTTVALFIKLRLKARQHQRRKLLTIILLTLVFFLLFAFPLNTVLIITISYFDDFSEYIIYTAVILACLNSSVNPAIYTLVGRQRKSICKESMKMILQKVFKEEEDYIESNPS